MAADAWCLCSLRGGARLAPSTFPDYYNLKPGKVDQVSDGIGMASPLLLLQTASALCRRLALRNLANPWSNRRIVSGGIRRGAVVGAESCSLCVAGLGARRATGACSRGITTFRAGALFEGRLALLFGMSVACSRGLLYTERGRGPGRLSWRRVSPWHLGKYLGAVTLLVALPRCGRPANTARAGSVSCSGLFLFLLLVNFAAIRQPRHFSSSFARETAPLGPRSRPHEPPDPSHSSVWNSGSRQHHACHSGAPSGPFFSSPRLASAAHAYFHRGSAQRVSVSCSPSPSLSRPKIERLYFLPSDAMFGCSAVIGPRSGPNWLRRASCAAPSAPSPRSPWCGAVPDWTPRPGWWDNDRRFYLRQPPNLIEYGPESEGAARCR